MNQKVCNIGFLILSAIAIGFSLYRVTPFTISGDTYVGTIVTLLSAIVAFAIGYQILNVVEIRGELSRLKDECKQLLDKNKRMESLIQEQQSRNGDIQKRIETYETKQKEVSDDLNEKIYITFAHAAYASGTTTAIGNAFVALHNSLLFGLNVKNNNFKEVFSELRLYLAEMDKMSIGIIGAIQYDHDNVPFISDGKNKSYVYELVDSFSSPIYQTEKELRDNPNFDRIKEEYNILMKHFKQRMEWFRVSPNKILTLEEKDNILTK